MNTETRQATHTEVRAPVARRRVLVTGATTPLGARIVRALLLRSRTVERVIAVGIERGDEAFSDLGGRLDYHRVDLTRTRTVRRFLFGPVAEAEVDTVIHGSLHRSAHDSGRKVHALNVQTTRQLLDLAERHPTIKRFVFRSHVDVYRLRGDLPDLVREDHPVHLGDGAPQWIRDRVEADVTVCTRLGMSPLEIALLRVAECPMPRVGSQLFDYLQSSICFRPLGYDPMINLISPEDVVRSVCLAAASPAEGIFNIPGRETLPLSRAVSLARRRCVAIPGPLVGPIYRMRRAAMGTDFRYDMNRYRFHYNAVMDGARARQVLGYQPETAIDWRAPSRLKPGRPRLGVR